MESKLNNIEEEANKYTLPQATANDLGGVKVGNNISLSSSGVISIPQAIGANNNPTFNNLTLTGKITLTGGDINSNTDNAFLSGEYSLLTLNGFMYTKAILNYGETGSGTTGVVFGSGSSYGTDEISFITSGDTQMYINDNGVGILTTSPDVALDIGSSDAIRIPRGSTAQRPSTTTVGMIRYNTTTTEYEAWYGGSTTGEWSSLGGTSTSLATNTINIGTNNNEFTVDSAGATSIASTLNVNGKTTINNALDVTGDVSFSDTMRVQGHLSVGKGISTEYALDVSGDFRVRSKGGFEAIRVNRDDDNNPYVVIGDDLGGENYYSWGSSLGNANDEPKRVMNNEFDRIPLHVGNGYSIDNVSFRKLADLQKDGTNNGDSNFTRHISIITKESILIGGDGVFIYSDKRIKNNIQNINDNQALLDFRQLNPCTYSYVDKVQRGNKTVYGFIAQEVEEVLPYACNTQIETVPNVYGFATISPSGKNLTLTMSSFNNLETTDASNNPMSIILKLTNGEKEFYVNVENVIDEMNVEISEPLLFENCVFDDSLNEYVIFIYGQRVDNFKSLDKNAIWTVVAAATQEIDRQQQADKVRIAELETKVETLESQLANVLARLTALENA
jgi:hypothetical protein